MADNPQTTKPRTSSGAPEHGIGNPVRGRAEAPAALKVAHSETTKGPVAPMEATAEMYADYIEALDRAYGLGIGPGFDRFQFAYKEMMEKVNA